MSDRDRAIDAIADAAVELWEKAADSRPLAAGDTFTFQVPLSGPIDDSGAVGALVEAIQRKGRFSVSWATGASSFMLSRTNMPAELQGARDAGSGGPRGVTADGRLDVSPTTTTSGEVTSDTDDEVTDMNLLMEMFMTFMQQSSRLSVSDAAALATLVLTVFFEILRMSR